MRRLKHYLPPLFTMLLIVLGAAMPWLTSQAQDARISRFQEKLALNAVDLTLRKDAGVGPALAVVAGDYTVILWEDETRMTEREAVDTAVGVLDQMDQYSLLPAEEIVGKDDGWAEPLLMIAEDGSTALVWHCYWKASPCVVAVDDASGKAVRFLISSWPPQINQGKDLNLKARWERFFWDYYGMELEDMEGLSLRIYEDYTSFNF